MAELTDIRETVRQKYAAAAKAASGSRADMAAWTGCVAGALTESEFRQTLQDGGFEQIEIRETHRVHEHAAAAIIRAHKTRANQV
jgi:tagatose-1,6-bisphosphate aldolase